MKKVLAVVGVVALFALGWAVSLPLRSEETAPAPEPAGPEVAETGSAAGRTSTATKEDPAAARRSAVPVAAAAAAEQGLGALRLVARFSDTAAPIPNVPARLWADRADAEERFEWLTVATGADGTCTVGGLSPGPWRIAVFGGAQATAIVRAGATTDVEVPLSLRAVAMQWARGRVCMADGQPAAHATLVLGAQGARCASVIGSADEAGRFAFAIPTRMVLIGARLAGHAPSPLQIAAGRDDLELVLGGKGATVAGLVVDAEGAPVLNAVVEVGEPQRGTQWIDAAGMPNEFPTAQRLTTDQAGRFLAADLPAGLLSVHVRAEACAPFHSFVECKAGVVAELRCELVHGAPLGGRVLDETGAPVAGAHVSLGGTYGEARRTDAEGRFGYRHVAIGAKLLEVRGDDIATTRSERAANATGEWLVATRRLPKYLLRLVDEDGGPLAQWRVRLQGRRLAATSDEGRLSVHGLEGGEQLLFVGPPGSIDALVPIPWPASLLPGVESTIVLGADRRPTAVLAGRVLGPDGAPVLDGQVELCSAAGGYLFRQRLAEGQFTFEQVAAGDWVVVVHRAGRGTAGGSFPVHGLAHGERRILGDLRLPREGSLAVRVVNADGTVPRDTGVFLFDAESREHFAPPRDGQSHPWPEGRYTWRVRNDDALWQSGEVVVRAGEITTVDVVLRPGVRRYVEFPVPVPAWGPPKRIDFVLRAPDGSIYDQSDFDPSDELPYRYMPPLCLGMWRLELVTDTGARFAGAFELASMEPSREPIRIAVQPAR